MSVSAVVLRNPLIIFVVGMADVAFAVTAARFALSMSISPRGGLSEGLLWRASGKSPRRPTHAGALICAPVRVISDSSVGSRMAQHRVQLRKRVNS